jgi:hypothetical protein
MSHVSNARLILLSGLFLCAAPYAAFAACTQADTKGNWQAYSTNSSGVGIFCKLGVNAAGNIANSICTATNGRSAPFANGKITLFSGPTCTFKGSFRIGSDLNTVTHATMTRDKLVIQGVGAYPGGSFSFSLIRL